MTIFQDLESIQLRSQIPHLLKTWGLNKNIVEVGVRYGYFSRQLLSAGPENLYCIDHWAAGKDQDTNLTQNELNGIYLQAVSDFWNEKNVKMIRASSLQGSSLFARSSLDFVYIDANHTYEGCKRDVEIWYPLVRQGGILAGHDYIEAAAQDGTEFGVVEAVDEFIESIGARGFAYKTEAGYRSWMIYKTEGE